MKRLFTVIYVMFFMQSMVSQNFVNKDIDSLYKEDQFYIGVTYNLLGKQSTGFSQDGVSSGFNFGFIKDMPINKDRDVAIGLGLGYSFNSFNTNLLISKDDFGAISYSILDDSDTYTKNKISSHLIEFPFEFRWRTSNATDYNFWRIYTGFKLGYRFANIIKHEGDLGNYRYTDIEDFNELQYGLTLSTGYNTWNIHLYYALNPMFSNEAKVDGENIDINVIKVGLIFCIL